MVEHILNIHRFFYQIVRDPLGFNRLPKLLRVSAQSHAIILCKNSENYYLKFDTKVKII